MASGRKRKFENSPLLPPSWFPGANDTSSFINGDRVAAFDLIYACIQKPRAQKPIDRAANETDESESERERGKEEEGGRRRVYRDNGI